MLKHLPGDHRALPARIGGDDDPLHALKRLLDRLDLGLVRLAGAAGAIGNWNTLEHDRERVEAPRLPFVPHIAGLLGRQEVPSAETQIVLGDLKNRCSWRMAEGFSKKNSVRDADERS